MKILQTFALAKSLRRSHADAPKNVISRTSVVRPAAISRAFVRLPRLADSLEQSERVR